MNQLLDVFFCDLKDDLLIWIILHNLQYLNLIELKRLTVAVNQKTEEIKQLAFVETALRLAFNSAANLLYKLEQAGLIEQHSLVVVVHLLEEVNAAHVASQVVADRRNVRDQAWLYVLEVPDETN